MAGEEVMFVFLFMPRISDRKHFKTNKSPPSTYRVRFFHWRVIVSGLGKKKENRRSKKKQKEQKERNRQERTRKLKKLG